MKSELTKKGRRLSLYVYIFAVFFLMSGLLALAFSITPMFKAGPNLTKEQYQKPKEYYNIEIDKISDKLGTAENGKLHYYMVMDKNKNINIYEIGSKEAGKLSATDMASYKATKAIKTAWMPSGIINKLKKSLDPREFEAINKETMLSNYEFENIKSSFIAYGIVTIITFAILVFFNVRIRAKTAEKVSAFQEKYPQITDMNTLKWECDFGIPDIGIYIKGDFIISDHKGFYIEDIKNVVWMYQHIQRYYFIITNRNIKLFGYKGNANLPVKGRRNVAERGVAKVFGYISKNYPHIIIGFDYEKRKLYKDRKKEYNNS